MPTAAPTEAAAGEDPYEDSLVLLAEGEPDTGPAPLTVQFAVESLVVDAISGARYTWDFGDGSPKSNDASPTHTYEKAGEYTATIGIVDASFLTRTMRTMLYGVQTSDPKAFAGGLAALVVVAAIACVVPARRAARVDPIAAMRMD